MSLGEEDRTHYLKPKQRGIPTLNMINAPWTTCALPESHAWIQNINQKYGSVKEMWVRFFLLLSENNEIKEEWSKKIDKKMVTRNTKSSLFHISIFFIRLKILYFKADFLL